MGLESGPALNGDPLLDRGCVWDKAALAHPDLVVNHHICHYRFSTKLDKLFSVLSVLIDSVLLSLLFCLSFLIIKSFHQLLRKR